MPDIASLIAQLADSDTTKIKAARQEIQSLADHAIDDATRHALADALSAALITKPAPPTQVRIWICEHLITLVTRKQLPALLTAFCEQPDAREAVCRVLGTFASPIATDELIAQLKKEADPALRIAILNALVVQRWRETVPAVRSIARKDTDIAVRLHALEVLATFPVADNDTAYTDALQDTTPEHHPRIHIARTRFCETLVNYGEYITAQAIAASINTSAAPAAQKKAAAILLKHIQLKAAQP